jgi:hypothetical protein
MAVPTATFVLLKRLYTSEVDDNNSTSFATLTREISRTVASLTLDDVNRRE